MLYTNGIGGGAGALTVMGKDAHYFCTLYTSTIYPHSNKI